ncbi:hypothetical protein CsSME_00025190 [Camellia sinensis var. sinensis]
MKGKKDGAASSSKNVKSLQTSMGFRPDVITGETSTSGQQQQQQPPQRKATSTGGQQQQPLQKRPATRSTSEVQQQLMRASRKRTSTLAVTMGRDEVEEVIDSQASVNRDMVN